MATDTGRMRERARVLTMGNWFDGAEDAQMLTDAADAIDALRSECARLLNIVRLAESIEDISYVNFEFEHRLWELGVIGGEDD